MSLPSGGKHQRPAVAPDSDKALQEPIKERGDEAYQHLANEAGKRVFTVLNNLIDVRSRASNGMLQGEEVSCIILGAASGLAMIVARMDLKVENPTEGSPPAEVLMLNDLGNQFLSTIQQMREQDPIAKALFETREAAGGEPS